MVVYIFVFSNALVCLCLTAFSKGFELLWLCPAASFPQNNSLSFLPHLVSFCANSKVNLIIICSSLAHPGEMNSALPSDCMVITFELPLTSFHQIINSMRFYLSLDCRPVSLRLPRRHMGPKHEGQTVLCVQGPLVSPWALPHRKNSG